jgi:twitching motility protein PilT
MEILKSTMRTREYIERGEGEGKSLLDAMRDGANEGMQHFDGELERLVRDGTIELETAFNFATNPGNFRLQMMDYIQAQADAAKAEQPAEVTTKG